MKKSFETDNKWVNLLGHLPLSRTEQEIVARFASDTDGRGFLPVADIFRAHKLNEESVEILLEGVQSHPNFAVARVVLARELYNRGLLLDAWRLLNDSPVPLYDNVLAQKLLFKTAVAFGDESVATQTYEVLKQNQGLDGEIIKLFDLIVLQGMSSAREIWRNELSSKGIKVGHLPIELDQAPLVEPKKVKARSNAATSATTFNLELELDSATKAHIQQFHVVPLDEVFSGENVGHSNLERGQSLNTIELDSTTLADIYVKQGYYSKALGIYRRLLKLAPHNDLVRMKVSEVAKLEREQRNLDVEEDPVLFDKLEVVEIIDRQIRYFNHLLLKLS
ncbi:MAG: hypothetical protein NT027_12685 [Proteobacteria bacterium]|nr:hypothetical protein [Pseudomonadota bacterium]